MHSLFKMSFRAVLIAGVYCLSQPLSAATVSYQEDSVTNFKNPERGIRPSYSSPGSAGETIYRKYFSLEAYKNTDILPQSVMDEVASQCATMRSKGIKIIPRFYYAFSSGTDAPLPRILGHIEQLGKVLRDNSDVIAVMEAGFIGCWGEWHHDCSSDVNKLDNPAARKAILTKILSVLPKDRMVVIRYNMYKREIFGEAPLGPEMAFNGSDQARTGAQNDCFRYNQDDRGTYQGSLSIEAQKTFLSLDNRYVPQEGETCGGGGTGLTDCASAIKDFKRMHWDGLMGTFGAWASGGCQNYINMHYGYRIVLKNAVLPDEVRPGSYFNTTINMKNVGFGKIYNPRGCELVFKSTVTKAVTVVKLGVDVRRWTMDTVATVQLSAILPATMPEGPYQVFLNLPDTASRLYGRKEYSIQLANTGVWDDATGYNSLLHTVNVSLKAPATGPIQSTTGILNALPESGKYLIKNTAGILDFSYVDNTLAPVTFEIFTVSGAKLWGRNVLPNSAGLRMANWRAPGSGLYLLKISAKDKSSSLGKAGILKSFLVD